MNWVTDSIAGPIPVVSPDRPAVAFAAEPPMTWGQLREAELRYARALQAAGVEKGDRVAILMRNSVDYFVYFLAISRAGGVSVRLNWRLTGPELQFQLEDAGVRLLVLDDEFTDRINDIRSDVPVEKFVVRGDATPASRWAQTEADFLAGEGSGEFPELTMDDPCTLMYTSGTTGKPKGAVMSHGNQLWIASMQSMKWGVDSNTVAVTSGPLFHSGGFEVLLLAALVAHGTAVTSPSGGFTLRKFLEIGNAQNAPAMLAYSFMLYELARMDDLADVVPKSLGRIVTGGDTVMPWVYDSFETKIPQVLISQSYSLTEGGAVAVSLDQELAKGRESSVGRPNPMTEVKILNDAGEPVAVGEVGEIYLRSPGVSVGYWNRPEANAETFVDGWCRTGDLGKFDAEGFLTLAGRAKDMIRSGGENIFPAELERILTRHETIADAAVIGVPDPKYFEVGCAVLVPQAGQSIDVEVIRSFCAEQLAKYKIPKYFIVVDDLPRNTTGKVLKKDLRVEYAHLGESASVEK